MLESNVLDPIEPRVTKARTGFLAVSPEGSYIMIGVAGISEEDARSKFDAAVARWREVLARDVSWETPPS